MSNPQNEPVEPTPSGTGSRGRVALVLALVFTLIVSGAAAFFALRPTAVPVAQSGADLANCQAVNAGTCVAEEAFELASARGPAEGLNAVRILLETRPDLQQGCHIIAHEVGKKFLFAFGDNAIVPGNEWCSYGYYHGLMQTYGQQNPDQLVAYAEKLCSTIASTITEDCMHGLGHASYVATGSIREAMKVCEQVEGIFAQTCADAVIMEDIFSSSNGRMVTAFSPQDCLEYDNRSVLAGCARGLAAELSRAGLDLFQACAAFADPAIFQKCSDGFGLSLAGNYHSGAGSASEAQLASCASDGQCSASFGWISYLYLLNRTRAEEACRKEMSGPYIASCIDSVDDATRNEQLNIR